ncbi:TRAP transporter small permease, partial [Escherichia coli]|nr:TRAP transporter small permease [Escherichia coli]
MRTLTHILNKILAGCCCIILAIMAVSYTHL